ncbi:MAG TPA: NTP transferase domain-containing protein [Gemmatimonadales bacterium]|nr:NTP transferase domain-containing protein [Gemmatimonadales bacterium]
MGERADGRTGGRADRGTGGRADRRTGGQLKGAILAGGGATRFGGRAKGLEVVGGARILDRLVGTFVDALGEEPLLVANAPEADTWRAGLRVTADVRPGLGSLGGIYTAVVAAPAPVVCVAWDMPFVTAELVRALAAGLGKYDAYLPESGGRRGVEPLCAAYGPACAAAIAASLDRGDLRAIGFHRDVRVGTMPPEAVRATGDPERLFFNVNTAGDLTEADALWRLGSSR